MNFLNFILVRKLVLDKTDDADRANKLALLTSFVPGTWGMMMGVMLADREQPAPKRDVIVASTTPALPGGGRIPRSE